MMHRVDVDIIQTWHLRMLGSAGVFDRKKAPTDRLVETIRRRREITYASAAGACASVGVPSCDGVLSASGAPSVPSSAGEGSAPSGS